MEKILFNLEGRFAHCGESTPVPSSYDLPFFEYMGDGSPSSKLCGYPSNDRHCGRMEEVHQEINPFTNRAGITDHKYQARGGWDHDIYYCGHNGWD